MIEPTGYTALDLIGFTDRGAYDPTANYVKNDIVSVGNTKWRCKVDDTTGVTPAENTNWTIYLESATSLAGMDDVDITTPADGDGLVYDATAQKWKNVPIMTKEQWKKNGAYNLLPNNGTDKAENGTTFSVSPTGYPKGVVKAVVQANPSGNALYHFLGTNTARMTLPAGTYKLLGCPSGGGGSKYYLQGFGNHDYTSGAGIYEDGSGVIFTLTQENELDFFISIRSGFTEGGTLYFYPIITTDLNATLDDYVPHAETNRELTFNVVQDSSVEKTFAYNNQICLCSLIVKNLNLTSTGTWVTAYSLPSNVPKPRWETSFAAVTYPYTSSKSNAVVGKITTGGDIQLWIGGVTATPVTQVAMNFMYPV